MVQYAKIIPQTNIPANIPANYSFFEGKNNNNNGSYNGKDSNGNDNASYVSTTGGTTNSPNNNNITTSVIAGVNTSTIAGETVTMELPYSLRITQILISPRANYPTGNYTNRIPNTIYVCGSNNGTSWYLIQIVTGLTTNSSTTINTRTFYKSDINAMAIYKRFKFIITQLNNTVSSVVSLNCFFIKGYPYV